MLRRLSLLAILIAATTLSAGGCRSCESCRDYDNPVASCNSGSCDSCDSSGYGRSGSALSYVATGDDATDVDATGPVLANEESAYK